MASDQEGGSGGRGGGCEFRVAVAMLGEGEDRERKPGANWECSWGEAAGTRQAVRHTVMASGGVAILFFTNGRGAFPFDDGAIDPDG